MTSQFWLTEPKSNSKTRLRKIRKMPANASSARMTKAMSTMPHSTHDCTLSQLICRLGEKAPISVNNATPHYAVDIGITIATVARDPD